MDLMDYFRWPAKINTTHTIYTRMRGTCVLYTITLVQKIFWFYLITLPATLLTRGSYLCYSIMFSWVEWVICFCLICGETLLHKGRESPYYLVAVSSENYGQNIGECKAYSFHRLFWGHFFLEKRPSACDTLNPVHSGYTPGIAYAFYAASGLFIHI